MIVMYAGRKVEEGLTKDLFADPCHPYLQGLLASVPRLGGSGGERLREIPGIVPPLFDLPNGCAFAPRCPSAIARCQDVVPPLEPKRSGHTAACWVT
jgi:peptide/nickel transport system ATP-binding protein